MLEPDFQLFSTLRFDPLLTSIPSNTSAWPTKNPSPSPYYMLPYHRDRLLQAAENFDWTAAADTIRDSDGFDHLLQKLNEAIDIKSAKPLRVKVLLSKDGIITIESGPTADTTQEALYPTRLPAPTSSSVPRMKVSPLTGGALELGENDSIPGDPPKSNPLQVMPDTTKTTPSPYTSYKTTSRAMYDDARLRVGIQDFLERKEVLLISPQGEVMEGSLTSPYFWRDGRWVTPGMGSGGQIGTTRRWALERGLCVEGVVKVESLKDGEECWISNGARGFLPGKVKLN